MAKSNFNELKRQLGSAIKERRLERGWSQEKLAEQAHLHRTYIGDIERGERNVSFENLWLIAEAFQTSLSDLFAFLDANDHSKGKND